MFTYLVVLAALGLFGVISWFLWKSGFLFQAEKPQAVLEEPPVNDARARKLFLKRLERWREEGKVTREEYERMIYLCGSEWDEGSASR